jgi:CO dehydrogenase/acetyl-CoA synthase gamma subunit (corrinoid Fe-S protein)
VLVHFDISHQTKMTLLKQDLKQLAVLGSGFSSVSMAALMIQPATHSTQGDITGTVGTIIKILKSGGIREQAR